MAIVITSVKERTTTEEDGDCGADTGYPCTVEGTKDGEAFKVNIWCEYDGRDVDFEQVSGIDVSFDPDFMDALCNFPGFEEGMEQGYAKYEANL